MSMWAELKVAAALLLAAGCAVPASALAAAGTGDARAALGRTATPAEVAAWDIDVRPDFKGLPRGSGTVAQGQKVWDGKCASCHGDFGESNEVFTPLVGGTTADDIKRGRVAGMTGNQPYRTTLMKVSTVSTLWDYIHRAMPWNAPKSLSVNEVYAVTAYLLHLGEIVPADFALSDANIAEVQRRMPNRAGMTTDHGLWPGRGRPDTRNTACMSRCADQVSIASSMPDYARDAHGDLAQQQRAFGPVRGIAAAGAAKPAGAAVAAAAPPPGARLASQYQCVACHAMDRKLVGPSFLDIAGKYKGQDAHAALARKVKAGGQGAWGAVPMPPQPQIPDSDVQAMVGWILEAK
ncbi:c-type cytochrome [Cupriavidus nantongensis]|uniref:Cytochrome C n=1 Tax=Cupriavidus nantongensis TaxID=1796606 RepID=A0A142JDZ4_9BURK|nr:c-type cytochrome [Cupriavidus nantongensis]AMR76306.1 cytochrome C [Cupriavidus nantongensis]